MALLKESRELTNGIFYSWQDVHVLEELRRDREKLILTNSSFREALLKAVESDSRTFEHDGTVWPV